MNLPDSDSWESAPVAEVLEKEIKPKINPILVEAVLNPQYRRMVLRMEAFIQKFVKTDSQHVKFPPLSNPYLRAILSLLALHYGLRTVSTEGTRIIGQRIPHSRITSDTLSSIPPPQLEDEMSVNSKFIETSTNLKRQTGGASSSNLNLNQTYPRPDTVMEWTPIFDASNLQDQLVAYPTSIPQSQLMQPGASVSQPVLPPHGASASPYDAGNFLCNSSGSFWEFHATVDSQLSMQHLLMQGLEPLSQETLQYQPTSTKSGLLQDVVGALPPSQPSIQPPSQEPLLYQPTDTYLGLLLQDGVTSASQPSRPPIDTNGTSVLPSYNQLPTLQYGASIAGPSGPPLDSYGQSAFPSTLASQFQSYNPTNSTYMQFPMPQSTQPFSLEQMLQPRPAQPPSTRMTFQNQDVVNVPHLREDEETGRSEFYTVADARRRSQREFLANKSKQKKDCRNRSESF